MEGFVVAAAVAQQRGHVAKGFGVIGPQSHRFLQMGDGLGQPALVGQCVAKVVVHFRDVRPQPQGLLIACYRLVMAVKRCQGGTQVEVVKGHGGLGLQCMANQLNRLLGAACLVANHTQEVLGIGMARVGNEDLPIELLGERKLARLMIAKRQIKHIRDGGHCLLFY